MNITRRQFVKCGSIVAAGLCFFPKEVLAEPLARQKFMKSTLREAEKYLVSHGLEKAYVRDTLSDIRVRRITTDGVQLSARELRRKSYAAYKKAFRFEQLKEWGEEFCRSWDAELAAAQARSGVPYELTAALLGVESQYGRSLGEYFAVNVFLSAAENSARIGNENEREKKKYAALWELAGLLRLCSKYRAGPLQVMGSYAGAITPAQFMPSNLWKYENDGLIACTTFGDFFSVPSAITLASTYLQRNGSVTSYNPKDTSKYARMIKELAGELRKARGSAGKSEAGRSLGIG